MADSGRRIASDWLKALSALPQADPGSRQTPLAAQLTRMQARYLEQQMELWSAFVAGRTPQTEDADSPQSQRLAGREWRENPYFDYLRRSYLLAARCMSEAAEAVPLAGRDKERLRFAMRQWIDATSPANFAATNPRVIKEALETNGESIARGVAQLYRDVRKGRLSQSDESAFEVGRNLAATPGSVILENDLIQLIRYRPVRDQVAARPLVIVPPCINKFYVLDLQAENSFVRHALAAGIDVFMVSWRNVGHAQGHFGWDDYLELGVIAALRAARELAGSDRVNALGFCVGGTLLATALSVLAARGEPIAASATYLTTLLDYSETGQLGVFVDEAGVAAREASIGGGGIFPGTDLALVFSSLRANDLVWPYVEGNYLLGRVPPAFDILYWNADSTNLPGPMYCYYVRNTYLENRLRTRGALENCGVPVNLAAPALPSYVLATREDHIVPWRSAYRSLEVLGGDARFVLGASGHIAGVVNPPAKRRRSYWRSDVRTHDPEAWLAGAQEVKGSWWPDWTQWIAAHAGGLRKAPTRLGNRRYRAREDAPGRYVKERVSAP